MHGRRLSRLALLGAALGLALGAALAPDGGWLVSDAHARSGGGGGGPGCGGHGGGGAGAGGSASGSSAGQGLGAGPGSGGLAGPPHAPGLAANRGLALASVRTGVAVPTAKGSSYGRNGNVLPGGRSARATALATSRGTTGRVRSPAVASASARAPARGGTGVPVASRRVTARSS